MNCPQLYISVESGPNRKHYCLRDAGLGIDLAGIERFDRYVRKSTYLVQQQGVCDINIR